MPSKTATPKARSAALSSAPASNCPSDTLPSTLSPAALALMADFFKVLSEVSRLQIVCALKSGAKNVTEVIEITGLGQANVSKHLKMLTQAGIVSRRQDGVCVYYQIANPLIFQLCELVCEALSSQIEYQSKQMELLDSIRQS